MRFRLALCSLMFVVDSAWACTCMAGITQSLWDHPEQARLAALVKLKSEPGAGVPKAVEPDKAKHEVDIKAWTTETISHWQSGGTSCDLRPNEETWYVVISRVRAGANPTACDSILVPVDEAKDLITLLSKMWETSSRKKPNPHWSVGCMKNQDCVIVPKGRCTAVLAVNSKSAKAAGDWKKMRETDVNCSAPSESVRAPQATCRTNVCEL